jgi:DNA replication and repair protein RecF
VEIKKLRLENFRSYSEAEFEFSPETTLIVGPNASGKTNLLEAIYLLAHGETWRPGVSAEMIRREEEVGRVKGVIGEIPRSAAATEMEVVLTRGEVQGNKSAVKRYLVNGVGKRRRDFLDRFAVVLFSPEDIRLVLSSPRTRRVYLDRVLEGVDGNYRRRKVEYENALRMRNALLNQIREGKAGASELAYWSELVASAGRHLSRKREEFIKFVNQRPGKVNGDHRLRYEASEISLERLRSSYRREVAAGATLIGPHRDDFKFQISDAESLIRDLAVSGSRGEQRTAVFWLKLGELAYVTDKIGQQPVLLLDDLFSELDHERRRRLLEIIPRHQTILTTTDIHLIGKEFLRRVRLIELG